MIKESVGGESFFLPETKTVRSSEIEKKSSAGMAMVIVGIDLGKNGENINNPALWTNIERKPKPATDRLVGQISFPSDTRKAGEDEFSNMLGTLAEFSGNNDLIRGLVFMRSSYTDNAIQIKGNYYGLMVAILNGLPSIPIVPFDGDEVAANGWMNLNELQIIQKENPSRLRSFVGQIIDMEKSDRIIHSVVKDYLQYPERGIPLSTRLSSDFSMVDFYNRREQMRDVVGIL